MTCRGWSLSMLNVKTDKVSCHRSTEVPKWQVQQKKAISLENQLVHHDEGSLKTARKQDRMPTGPSGILEDLFNCCVH